MFNLFSLENICWALDKALIPLMCVSICSLMLVAG